MIINFLEIKICLVLKQRLINRQKHGRIERNKEIETIFNITLRFNITVVFFSPRSLKLLWLFLRNFKCASSKTVNLHDFSLTFPVCILRFSQINKKIKKKS